eukprot:jgi/Ulvmu1/928/UM102_0011.1
MPRRRAEPATPSELILPDDNDELRLNAAPQLTPESNTYGSALVYGSSARWVPVYNAPDLRAAIVSGVAHIEIHSHLDLTSLTDLADSENLFAAIPSSVKSITGNCQLPVSSVALRERDLLGGVALLQPKPRQCLLVHNHNVFATAAASLWIDNLYLRVGPKPDFPTAITMKHLQQPQLTQPPPGKLWLTDITIQSNGVSHSIGIDVQTNSNAYLQGVTFAHFNGSAAPVHVGHPAGSASVSLVGCSFSECSLTPSPDASGLVTAWSSAAVRMQLCSASACTADWTVRQADTGAAAVIADAMPIPSSAATSRVGGVQSGTAAPLAAAGVAFLTASDEWLLQTRGEVIAAFGIRSEDSGSLRSSVSGLGINLTMSLLIAASSIVALAVLAYMGHRFRRGRDRRRQHLQLPASAADAAGSGTPAADEDMTQPDSAQILGRAEMGLSARSSA